MVICTCPSCKSQLAFCDEWKGKKALCPHCQEFLEVPKGEEGAKVAKSSFSPVLQQFVKTKVEDIDDDPTDNKFLVPEEHQSSQQKSVQEFLKLKVEDIDDDPTDNKFLKVEEQRTSFSSSVQEFLEEKKRKNTQ